MKSYTHGQLIRQYREDEGLTQEELADIIKVSKGKLVHWEENTTIPNPRMVARLTGALRLSDEKEKKLNKAVLQARANEEAIRAEAQKIIDEQNAETERLYHKKKALLLFLFGVGGFVASLIFFFVIGSYRDAEWYFPIVIGLMLAGIPYGWNILTDKSQPCYNEPYSPDPEIRRMNVIIKLIINILKFIGAYLISIIVFPIMLFYHAYKAGRKGTLYRTLMGVLFVLISAFIGFFAFIIIGASLGN